MKKIWFITGSQKLYGKQTLIQVEKNSKIIVDFFNEATGYEIEFKALVKSKEEINEVFTQANSDHQCAGIIVFAHTFSPAKMWVSAFSKLDKPLLHLHTQFNYAIPANEIDMDYMNLHQSAHGDRELAHGMNVAGLKRDIVCGYYKSEEVIHGVIQFCGAVQGIACSRNLKVVRFGDNMNCVAVTDGNKVLAEKQLGWTIDTVGIADLVKYVDQVTELQIDKLIQEYINLYDFAANCAPGMPLHDNVRYQAKIEIGLEKYLVDGNYNAFTTNFDQLTGLDQLPGLAVQRMMEKGYGFAGEGDWRTSAMTYILKVIANNEQTSFMEDYTYDYKHGVALQAHMLEICPTIGDTKPIIEVHPLGIGGKQAPARLTFEGKPADAIAVSLIELNGALRMVVNEVEVKKVPYQMPNLPVAATFWEPKPSLEVSAHAWLLAGGAHHTAYSAKVTTAQIKSFTKFYGIETIVIDEDTTIKQIEKELA